MKFSPRKAALTGATAIALSASALRQLEIALNLLGIDTPERM